MLQKNGEHFHFVGIGGAGMSGIAKILLNLGYEVSGSDLRKTEVTRRLEEMGAKVYEGHDGNNVMEDVDYLVVSTAIPASNEEVQAARAKNIPIIQRGEMLAKIMNGQKGIAVAGAHGKTTTTSMISLVLEKNNFDPTVVVGGELNDIGGNAKLGKGDYMVAEADESDGSFLKLSPFITVVTNIEDDHMDYYGSMDKIMAAFEEFVNKVPEGGFNVLCMDSENVKTIAQKCKKPYITYAINNDARYRAKNINLDGLKSFSDIYREEKFMGQLELNVPGLHNISNALAAIAVSMELGLDFSAVVEALKCFKGVQRRFQIIGQVDGITVVDDYAHHPTEVKATLMAARQTKHDRVVGVFQPHRYTRTKQLYKEFGESFSNADMIVIAPLYSAGEPPIPGVSSELIIDAIEEKENKEVYHFDSLDEISNFLAANTRKGDLVMTIGAGNIWTVGVNLVKKLKAR